MNLEEQGANWFDFSKSKNQSFAVHSIRFAFLLLVLLIAVSFQYFEHRVDVSAAFYPLYVLIGLSLFLQVIYFIFFDSLYSNRWITSFLFFFEAVYITGLIYYIGIEQSILVFLYLVNLILYGILFQRKGALSLALWTSILFSMLLSMDPTLDGNTIYLAIGVNNLAFFTVAYLAGFLSEQLNIMGAQLKEKVRDVATLKNLNDLILANMTSGLVTVDNDGSILNINPKAQKLLSLTPESKLDLKLTQIMPGMDTSILSFDKTFDFILLREGEKRILSTIVNQLMDENGQSQGLIISFRDETHLRTLEKRLRQSEKMAAIGQLATGIAHEIRNPLAGISGSVQLMQSDDLESEQNGKLMNIIEREISRLNNLITEFLDFAKPEAPMEDQVKLGSLLKEILEVVQLDPERKQVACVLDQSENVIVLGNRDKLKQAFLNIIVNSYQALQKTSDAQLTVSVQKHGDYALVSIKDNGIGMDEGLKDRIFEPFHTTKQKGTGLGLAITHSILESHGAQIQVESEIGQGTEFRMSFKTL